jgi:alpha-N-arabinofuranosidase
MRLTSPGIKLVAAGSSNYRPNADPDAWNSTILSELKDVVDYIALHIYVGNPDNNYYNFLSTPLVCEQRTDIVRGMINKEMQNASRRGRDPIYIAWDEYNVWYRARTSDAMRGTRALEEHYNLEDALVIAGFLNVFIRNADVVKMANMAQLVNVIAPIFTSEEGMFKQTIYYPLQLFTQHAHGTSLDLFVECDTYDTERFFIGLGETTTRQTGVPYLDVSATLQDQTMVLCVVNRHRDEPITTDILCQTGQFSGDFEVYEVNGPDVKSENDFDNEPVQTVRKDDLKARGDRIEYTFPPHSFTLIKGRIE